MNIHLVENKLKTMKTSEELVGDNFPLLLDWDVAESW